MHTRLQFQTKKGERDEHRWHSFITFLHLWKQENCHAHDDLAMDTISLKTANKSEKTYIHTRVINLILMSTGNPHWSKCPVLPKILVTTPGRLQNHTNQDASTVLVWVNLQMLERHFFTCLVTSLLPSSCQFSGGNGCSFWIQHPPFPWPAQELMHPHKSFSS